MHVLTVIAKDLSPEHLLAAIKHWVAKFEQEIMHKDMGPSDRGSYEFEHDGVPTEVHWNPGSTVNHMQPQSGERGEEIGHGKVNPKLTDAELKAKMDDDRAAQEMQDNLGVSDKPKPTIDELNAMAGNMVQQAPHPAAAPTPAEPTEAAEHAAAQPDSTGADVTAAVAPDAA